MKRGSPSHWPTPAAPTGNRFSADVDSDGQLRLETRTRTARVPLGGTTKHRSRRLPPLPDRRHVPRRPMMTTTAVAMTTTTAVRAVAAMMRMTAVAMTTGTTTTGRTMTAETEATTQATDEH